MTTMKLLAVKSKDLGYKFTNVACFILSINIYKFCDTPYMFYLIFPKHNVCDNKNVHLLYKNNYTQLLTRWAASCFLRIFSTLSLTVFLLAKCIPPLI